MRVVPNKYPALDGRHEVIVHAPAHEAELEDLGDDALAEVLAMWQRRVAAHLESGAAAVTLIGNLGAGSGASLEHPHEQLFATPVVPPLLLDELVEAERHRNRYGTCVVCDEIEQGGRPGRAGRRRGRLGAGRQPLQRRALAGPGRPRGGLPRRGPRRRGAGAAPRAHRRQGVDRRRPR